MKTMDHGTGLIKIERGNHPVVLQYMPTVLHVKRDGAKNGGPSICFEMTHPIMPKAFAQMTIQTLKDCLAEIGYRLEEIVENKPVKQNPEQEDAA